MSLYVETRLSPGRAHRRGGACGRGSSRTSKREGVVTGQRLVAEHSVVLDPAYVHITKRSLAEHKRIAALLQERGVWSLGRYGRWTYCAIEDNIVEARELVESCGSRRGCGARSP